MSTTQLHELAVDAESLPELQVSCVAAGRREVSTAAGGREVSIAATRLGSV